ncbi:MAG: PHP domain-containing protein [Dehalococcoidia bacterium]
MLKADLHSHTYFSPDCLTAPERYVAACQRRGINCVAVTDHNTIQGGLAVQKMAPFRVIIGEEVRTGEGEITGLFLTQEVPGGLTLEETVRRIKEQGGLISIPHPFDRFRGEPLGREALLRVLAQVDIIEVFNARTTLPRDNQRAVELALKHDLAMGAGSDAHSPWEVGRAYVEMPEFDGGPQEFLQALRQGRVVGRRSSPLLIHLVSRWAALRRRLGWRPVPSAP